MLETMLSKPKFIPSSWVKQYEGMLLFKIRSKQFY
ncbi:hypothetical protein GCK32_019672 [Trichostrongylus colubriformis]|uniref:Uncharacterized protein n=1 Tax=Trichostrongylus colubriformis TaxID=6319 RepID=A0AAN8ILI7_TRICO